MCVLHPFVSGKKTNLMAHHQHHKIDLSGSKVYTKGWVNGNISSSRPHYITEEVSHSISY